MNLSRALGFTLLSLMLLFHGSIHAQEKVTIQLKWFHQFQFAGYYAAIEKGFYTDEGLDVELRERNPATSHINDVLDGRAQYGVADAGLILSRIQGKPVVLLSQIFQHSPLVFLTLKESGIRTPYDLIGKRITLDNVGYGNAPITAMLLNTLGGLETIDVQPTTFRHRDLIEGKTDAYASYITDQLFSLRELGAEVNILDPRDYGVDFYGDNLFTTEQEVKENPLRVERLRKATLRGWRYALENPDEMVELIFKKYNPQKQSRAHLKYQANETVKMIVPEFVELGSFEPSRFQKISETYAQLGIVQSQSIDQGFFYNQRSNEIGLTNKEILWLAEHQEIRIGINRAWPPMDYMNSSGEPAGIGVGFIESMNRRLGNALKIVPGKWTDIYQQVKEGTLDALMDITDRPDRQQYFNFTTPYIEVPHVIFSKKGGAYYTTLKDLEGKTVGVEQGFYIVNVLKDDYPGITIEEFDTTADAIDSLAKGQVDAYVGNRAVATHIVENELISNIEAQGKIDETSSITSIGVRKDQSILRDILQKALSDISEKERNTILHQWADAEQPSRGDGIQKIALTDEEKSWLEAHPTIRFTGDPDWLPQEAFTEGGHYTGIVSEVLNLIDSRLGISIERVPSKTWSDAVRMTETQEVDILSETAGVKRQGLTFSDPHLQFPVAIIVRTGSPPTLKPEHLHGRRVAVVRDYGYVQKFQKNYPDLDYIVVDSVREGLLNVSSGSVDAFISATSTASYLMSELGLTNLEFSGYTGLSIDLAFGIRDDWSILVGLFNKVIASITREEKVVMKERWFGAATNINEPSLVSLSLEEKQWLEEHPEVTLSFTSEFEPLIVVGSDGELSGILIDIYDEISALTGLNFKIDINDWPTSIAKAKDGEVDGLLLSAPVLAESIGLSTTQPLSRGTPTIYAKTDAPLEINSIEDLIGKRVAVLKGLYIAEQALVPYKDKIDIIQTETSLESLQLVFSGKADVALGLNYNNYLIGKHTLVGIEAVHFIHDISSDAPASVRKEWPELVSIINKGINALGLARLTAINNQWTKVVVDELVVTKEEKTWLEEHPIIQVVVDPDWAPVEYQDEQGNFNGISFDYLKRVEQMLGVQFKIVDNLSWAEGLEAVKSKQADMLASAARTPQRESYLRFTQPYVTMPIAIFARNDVSYIGDLENLSGKRVAVVRNYAAQEWLKRDHPNLQLVTVDSPIEGLEKVSHGTVDVFVGNTVSVTYYLGKLHIDNIRLAGETSYEYAQTMAVRDDWPILAGILQKALNTISQQERNLIFNSWMSIQFEYEKDYTLLWMVLIGAALLLLMFAFWNRRLQAAKNMAEEAGEQLRLFRMLTEASGQGIGMAHMDGNISYMNPRLKQICEIEDESASTDKFISFYSDWAKQKFTNEIMPSLMKNGQWTGELELKSTSGEYIPTIENFFIVNDQQGTPLFIADVVTDISERKESEALLRASDERFQQSLNFATIGAWDWDILTGELVWSDQIALLFGYPAGNLETNYENFIGAVHPDDRDNLENAIKACVEEGSLYEIEHRVVWPNGEIRWLHERGDVTRDEDGNPVHMLGVVQDVTETKNILEALQLAREDAEAANRSKSSFLATMSHEIRTPMNAIIGMANLALQTELNAKQQNYIQKVSISAESLLGIINDILDFSKIEADRLEIESVDFRLDKVLDNLSNLVGLKAEDKGLEFVFDIDPNVPLALIGDPLRLGQVLVNLGGNAVKFTDKGEVIVGCKVIDSTDTGVTLRFSVQDTGIGLSTEQKGSLFRAFSQADGTISRKYGGTGLGLVISKRLVELMGGELGVSSEPGKGSTFFFSVNLGYGKALTTQSKILPPDLQDLRILVVDDNHTAREILVNLISGYGMSVEQVDSGEAAISLLEKAGKETQPFNLLIVDWQMPGMDGLNTIRSLQRSAMGKELPATIMVTAYSADELRSQADGVMLSSILVKPVQPSSLLDAIVDALGYAPVSIISDASHEMNRDETSRKLHGARILLVEDNEINQELAVDILSDAGCHVEVANDGIEAIQKMEKSTFDGVLMDIHMPEMDGLEATRKIRKQERFETIPIIAMTAAAMKEDHEQALAAGMNDFITKPVDVNTMFSTIAKWIKPTQSPETAPRVLREEEQPDVNLPALEQLEGVDIAAGLKMTQGKQGLYIKLLKQFHESYKEFFLHFNEFIMDDNNDEAHRLAHTLKGTAGTIGAKAVQERAEELERSCKNMDENGVLEDKLSSLMEVLQPVLESLAALVVDTEEAPVTHEALKTVTEVMPQLRQLEVLLSRHDGGAVELVDEIYAQLRTGDPREDISVLKDLINRYRFKEARILLSGMTETRRDDR